MAIQEAERLWRLGKLDVDIHYNKTFKTFIKDITYMNYMVVNKDEPT